MRMFTAKKISTLGASLCVGAVVSGAYLAMALSPLVGGAILLLTAIFMTAKYGARVIFAAFGVVAGLVLTAFLRDLGNVNALVSILQFILYMVIYNLGIFLVADPCELFVKNK